MASFEPIPVVSSSSGVGLNGIRPPGENDVVLGAGCNKHCGNLKFRQFIKAYKRARLQSSTKIEHVHAAEVVHFWRKLTPPGRFLAKTKSSPDGHWNEVNDKQAIRIASFFLCNQNGDELKRQKSTDAIRNSRNFQQQQNVQQQQTQVQVSVAGQDFQIQGQAYQYQSQAVGSMNGNINGGNMSGNNQMNRAADGLTADFMSSLEPMPIGTVGSSSSCNVWDGGQPQKIQSSNEPIKATFHELEQDIDFNPLPFKANNNDDFGVDDFEPLPTTFSDPFSSSCNQNACAPNPIDMSTPPQFGGAGEQVQVSVNMVVNTMPQGYPRENAFNTVTNIQIGTGTISEERRPNDAFLKPSHNDGMQGSNFRLKTDATNGFIQISAQSNPTDCAMNMAGPGMSNQGNTLPGFNNAGSMGVGGQYGANGNVPQGSGGNQNNFERRSINLSINNVAAPQNGGGHQKNSITWNKIEVANSVPDAASLVGSFFDDW